MEKIQFDIGTPVVLEIVSTKEELANVKMKSSIVGGVFSDYIILTMPKNFDAKVANISIDHCSVLVRYVYDGEVFGFESNVIHKVYVPTNLIFIHYPLHIEEISLRAEKRISCFLHATFRQGKHVINGTIVDISQKGCCFLLKHPDFILEKADFEDQSFELTIQFPGVAEDPKVEGVIRSFVEEEKDFVFGFEFSAISADFKALLKKFLVE